MNAPTNNNDTSESLQKNNQHKLINSFSELKKTCLELFANANKTVQIYSHHLDPRILNNPQVEQQLIQFIKKSRYCKVQILIYDENNLRGIDHRLVSLAQKFTSYIEIKIIPKDYHENPFAFYLIDQRIMLYRSQSDNYTAELSQMPDFYIKEKTKLFDNIWQISSPASFLRALHL